MANIVYISVKMGKIPVETVPGMEGGGDKQQRRK
jgi:hypothetical protein